MPIEHSPILPGLQELLTGGGDARIIPNSHKANKYGCFAYPRPEVLAYGSSTASTISPRAYDGCMQLYLKLQYALNTQPAHQVYARELNRIRGELAGLIGFANESIIFGASGTDLHLFAAQLCAAGTDLRVIMCEAEETGSGVRAAFEGRHFSTLAAVGGPVRQGERIAGTRMPDIIEIRSRLPDGGVRPAFEVDAAVEEAAVEAITAGGHVLLVLVDVSKTGLITPGISCALRLKQRFPDKLDVLVDACQFRLCKASLNAYLDPGFLVAVTGSKFVTGPAFCAALLAPERIAARLRRIPLPAGLSDYSCRADWPEGWEACQSLSSVANLGLLLRLEAALTDLRAFCALSEPQVFAFVDAFAETIQDRLNHDPALLPLETRPLDRTPLLQHSTWDQLPTLFPFLLRHPSTGRLLSREETRRLYEQLPCAQPHIPGDAASLCCLPGQPVECGLREATPLGALRLSLDMRLIADALSQKGRGPQAVIGDALRVLDKTALLARYVTP